MWCSHCQQEVPAVARSTDGPLFCSLCEQRFAEQEIVSDRPAPADTGVALESYDVTRSSRTEIDPPIDLLQRDETWHSLRRIGRKLRTPASPEVGLGGSSFLPGGWSTLGAVSPVVGEPRPAALSAHVDRAGSRRGGVRWPISLLLAGGGIGFGLGVGVLAWSAAFDLPRLWQWGMTATIAAEGTLILGLVWMAVRLWNNGRRVNRQLHGVDSRLSQIQTLTDALAGGGSLASPRGSGHFPRAASPYCR